MISPRRRLQLVALAVFLAGVVVPPGVATMGRTGHPFFHADPYLALLAVLGSGALPWATTIGALLLLTLTATRGALFCREFCPLGTIQDLVPRVPRAGLAHRLPHDNKCPEVAASTAASAAPASASASASAPASAPAEATATVMATASVAAHSPAPPCALAAPRVAGGRPAARLRLRPWVLLVLLVAGVVGSFPASLADPLSIVAQAALAAHDLMAWPAAAGPAALLSLSLLATIVAFSLRTPRPFCRHLCPLGEMLQAVQRLSAAASAQAGAVALVPAASPATGAPSLGVRASSAPCAPVSAIPANAVSATVGPAAGASTAGPSVAGASVATTAVSAATVVHPPSKQSREAANSGAPALTTRGSAIATGSVGAAGGLGAAGGVGAASGEGAVERERGQGVLHWTTTRRGFLGAAASVPLGAVLGSTGAGAGPLRPPGALAERAFLRTCIRCGQCIAACPTGAIVPSLLEAGIAGLLAPRLALSKAPCLPGCTACQLVCPSGALRQLSSAERRGYRIGLAHVRPSRCLRAGGKDCQVCRDACPFNALSYPISVSPSLPKLEPDLCIGCGICENACPARGGIVVEGGGAS